jgi:hypothetical protein
LSPLLERGLLEAAAQFLEQVGRRTSNAFDGDQLLSLSNDFPLAGEHVLLTPPEVVPLVLECRQIHRSSQIGLQQTRLLPAQSHTYGPQAGLTTSQFLGDPVAGLSALELVRNDLRVLHHLAQVVPDKSIQLVSWDEPGWAVLLAIGGHGRQLASAHVVLVVGSRVECAASATQLAVSTADQATQ